MVPVIGMVKKDQEFIRMNSIPWTMNRASPRTVRADKHGVRRAHAVMGAFLLETVPSVLYILERYQSDPQEAIRRAVMDTWDNDTIAAIVGAVMGAMYGMDAFAKEWIDCLPGRTGADDDGRLHSAYKRLRALGGYALND